MIDHYRVVKCSHCGFIFVNPRPSEQALVDYYRDYHNPDPAQLERETHRQLTDWLEGLVGSARSVFEIGCGEADLLYRLHAEGFAAAGCDPHATPSREPWPIKVHRATLRGCAIPAESLDLVIARNVVEHLRDPIAELEEVARVLRPDGLLYIKVPNAFYAQGLPFRMMTGFGPRSDDYLPPFHLSYFTRPTLTSVLERTGFAVTEWRCELPSRSPKPLAHSIRRSFHYGTELLRRISGSRLWFHATLACTARKRRDGATARRAQDP
jgi:SAM-dependent methyltransferase